MDDRLHVVHRHIAIMEAASVDFVNRPFAEEELMWDLITRLTDDTLPSSLVVGEYRHCHLYKWMVVDGRQDLGQGDLVLTDGHGNFAVVEVKHLDYNATGHTARVRRRVKRQRVKEQAVAYLSHWLRLHPTLYCNTVGIALSNSSSHEDEYTKNVYYSSDVSL